MSNRQIMIAPSRLDLANDIWISCLFVPLVAIYTHLLIFLAKWINAAERIPEFKFINLFLSLGIAWVLSGSIKFASRHSKNDFIAGPIEVLNLYTFFFLGLLMGGVRIAIFATLLYEIFETWGWRIIFQIDSISENEWEKAKSLGISHRYFKLYQFVFAPLATIASLWIAIKFSEFFFPIDSLASMNYANQIGNLSILLASWKACETLLISFYNKFFPTIGFEGVLFSITLFTNAYFLSIYNNRTTWLLYGGFIVLGWITIIMQSMYLFMRQVEDEGEREYMKKLREKNK